MVTGGNVILKSYIESRLGARKHGMCTEDFLES